MKNIVLYCVYVRSHGTPGTFKGVEQDLPRIKSIGVDYIWLLPHYPIGETNRKGILGSPYSISDYRGINPEYGTLSDFQHFIESVHGLGMKLMIDIVFNHTSYDHIYLKSNPGWYNRDPNGNPIARVPAWSDIIDLRHTDGKFVKYSEPNLGEEKGEELWDELVDVLKYWVELGVDGFRCDVAPFVPLPFWETAVKEVAKVKPETIWLAESYTPRFLEESRREYFEIGLPFVTIQDLHRAFSLTYAYESYPAWRSVLAGNVSVQQYLEVLRLQNFSFPTSATKMRFVENHDTLRIANVTRSRNEVIAWTAFASFNSGAFLIYGGQEAEAKNRPSLFEQETIEWGEYPLQELLRKLVEVKHKIPSDSVLTFIEHSPAIVACWETPKYKTGFLGVFNVKENGGSINISLVDGVYEDATTHSQISVKSGTLLLPESFIILEYTVGNLKNVKAFKSYIFDVKMH